MTTEKQAPQCQAKLKSGERCQRPARHVIDSGRPSLVCGTHASESSTNHYFFSEEIDPADLPDSLLQPWLRAWRNHEEHLLYHAARVQRHAEDARLRAVACEGEIQRCTAPAVPEDIEDVFDDEDEETDAAMLCDLLSLTHAAIPLAIVETWSQAERAEACEWAAAEVADASDNLGVIVPPMPACVVAALASLSHDNPQVSHNEEPA